jgi:hypothetical protein
LFFLSTLFQKKTKKRGQVISFVKSNHSASKKNGARHRFWNFFSHKGTKGTKNPANSLVCFVCFVRNFFKKIQAGAGTTPIYIHEKNEQQKAERETGQEKVSQNSGRLWQTRV